MCALVSMQSIPIAMLVEGFNLRSVAEKYPSPYEVGCDRHAVPGPADAPSNSKMMTFRLLLSVDSSARTSARWE